jgi:hypothetical protein
MKNNAAIIIAGLFATVVGGCAKPPAPEFRGPVIQLVRPVPINQGSETKEPLYQFAFGGLYRISDYQRYADAARFAERAKGSLTTFTDGGFSIVVKPVPFGLRLKISNRLHESVTLQGAKASFIDVNGRGHAVELRDTTALYPDTEPIAQHLIIPPATECQVDLDVLLPIYRRRINQQAATVEERGAFVVTDAPLPIFCSGYFLYDSNRPKLQPLREWAFNHRFGLYLELEGNGAQFGYRFILEPYRFAIGPKEDPDWELPELQPYSLDKDRRQ